MNTPIRLLNLLAFPKGFGLAVFLLAFNPSQPAHLLRSSSNYTIEIDSQNFRRQVVKINDQINWVDDAKVVQTHPSVTLLKYLSFAGTVDPCTSGSTLIPPNPCIIRKGTEGRYTYIYCSDFTLKVTDGTCPSFLTGQLLIQGTANNPSTIILSLTKTGEVNHVVQTNDVIKWRRRNSDKQSIKFKTSSPCGKDPNQLEVKDSTECTISAAAGTHYDYDCLIDKDCVDPTIHVSSDDPSLIGDNRFKLFFEDLYEAFHYAFSALKSLIYNAR